MHQAAGVHVVLVAPEIAPNTGSVIRLCANTGARLHLVEPLGFTMDDRLLRRGGLDYHDLASVTVHPDLASALVAIGVDRPRYAFRSNAVRRYDEVAYGADDVLVFGAERAGLTGDQLRDVAPATALYLPMRPDNRSLNLANAVAVVVYEAWRQNGFAGSAVRPDPATGSGQTAETLVAGVYDS